MINNFNIKNIISPEEIFVINLLFDQKKVDKTIFKSINYENLTRIASSNLILPSIYINFKKKGYLNLLPNDFSNYLKEIFEINKERNKELLIESKYISNLLKKNSIEHVFLKGTANLFYNVYDDIGERMIGDIDILINEKISVKAYNLLIDYGYIPISNYNFFQEDFKHHHRQVNKDKLFAIEIHKRPNRSKSLRFSNTNKILSNRTNIDGMPVPSIYDLLLNNIYNSQINDFGYSKLNYNYRLIYDTHLLLKKENKFLSEIKFDKYINSFLCICKILNIDSLKIEDVNNFKFILFRFIMRKKFKYYFLSENFLISFFYEMSHKPKQLKEFLINPEYRKYIKKKYLKESIDSLHH